MLTRPCIGLLCLALVALPACGDDFTASDAGPREAGAESAPDGPSPDGPLIPDGPVPDSTSDGQSDAPSNAVTALFSSNASSSAYTLYSVKTDGTGAAALSGVPADLDILDIDTGGSGPVAVRVDRPLQRVVDSEEFITVPGGGRVYRYDDGSNIGLALVKGGAWTKLDDGPKAASYGDSGNYTVAISADGKVLVAAKNKNQLVLIRLDGANWTGTSSPVLDASAANWSSDVQSISDASLRCGATHVYFQSAGSVAKLWRAPLDGSAKASEIVVAGASYFDEEMAVSNDGATLAFVAGGSSTSNEVYSLADGASSAPVKVSGGAQGRNHYTAGTALFDSGHPRLAISPTGQQIAYGHTGNSSNWSLSIYVVKADGSARERINTPANFDSAVDTFRHFVWADDDNLVFWAGASASTQDAYRFQVSSKTLSNLTKTATETSAPFGAGALELNGGWVEPAGKYFYGVVARGGASNILCIALSTFGTKWITTGLDLPTSSSALVEDYRGRVGAKMVCFVGRGPGTPTIEDVFAFDQSTSGLAVNLTKHADASGVFARYVEMSPDGKYCSFQTGSSSSAQYFIVAADGTGSPQAMTSPTATNGGSYVWTSDSSGIVFGAGGSTSTASVFFSPVSGGGATPIYSTTTGYVYVFSAE